MKKSLLITFFMVCHVLPVVHAQMLQDGRKGKMIQAERAYRIFANNETNPEVIKARNDSLANSGVRSRGSFFWDLGNAIAKSYGTTLVQKTTNATSNLISLGVSYLSSWIYKSKNDRETWLKTARAQCHFERNLATETYIDDFYYAPSTSGALDPMDLKFDGFGCYSFLMPTKQRTDSLFREDNSHGKAKNSQDSTQLVEFYVSCKVRTDSVGRNHMANHSKFYVELDKLIFDTRHSCLPNDSTSGQEQKHFDFNARKNLTFKLNVKIYSSWVNEAIMLMDNQQIGEFNIVAKIDAQDLNEDSVFVYDKKKHAEKVHVTGDCFLVPRSYTGTADAPSWGTGQYRLEMTVSENCDVNENWYKIPIKEVGNAEVISNRNVMEKTKWDKKKWQAEWHSMKERKKGESVWKGIWKSITTAYIGNDWVQELVSPLANAVNNQEGIELNKLLRLNAGASAGGTSSKSNVTANMPTSGANVPTAGTGMPATGGGMPKGGGQLP